MVSLLSLHRSFECDHPFSLLPSFSPSTCPLFFLSSPSLPPLFSLPSPPPPPPPLLSPLLPLFSLPSSLSSPSPPPSLPSSLSSPSPPPSLLPPLPPLLPPLFSLPPLLPIFPPSSPSPLFSLLFPPLSSLPCRNGQFYYQYGFIQLALLLFMVQCGEISVLICHCRLCREDYRWSWRAYFSTASSGFYLFLFIMYYLISKTTLTGALSYILYLGYTFIAVFLFSLMAGECGCHGSGSPSLDWTGQGLRGGETSEGAT